MSEAEKAAVSQPVPTDIDSIDEAAEPAKSPGFFSPQGGMRDLLLGGILLALLVQIVLTGFVLAAENRTANLTNQTSTQQHCIQLAQVNAQSQTDYATLFKKCVTG